MTEWRRTLGRSLNRRRLQARRGPQAPSGGVRSPGNNGWTGGGARYGLLHMSDLERELDQELHRVLDPIAALPIPPRRMLRTRRGTRALLGGAGAALSFKLLTG